ncbi:MAG: zinc ABC transporter substrate-binding protein [Anaerolineales bacterium]
MKLFRLFLADCVLTASLFMTACQSAAPRASGLPRVMATESFLGDIAQNVARSRIKVDTLLPVTVDPHEYQPKPQDVTRLAQAQVLIVNGLGYEAWLQKTLDSLGGQRQVIVATNGLAPDPDPSGEHPEGDPHMWMNPLNTINYVLQIRDGLTQADPAGKDVYSQNADAYIAKLQALDQWVKDQVIQLPVERRLLVTNHDALGYFAKAYDFKIVGAVIPSVTTDASPSAQQLASLIDTIKSSGARAIFLDIGENQELALQIASETGVKVVTDLYVESTSGPNGPAPTYIDMIKYDVTTILDALK